MFTSLFIKKEIIFLIFIIYLEIIILEKALETDQFSILFFSIFVVCLVGKWSFLTRIISVVPNTT